MYFINAEGSANLLPHNISAYIKLLEKAGAEKIIMKEFMPCLLNIPAEGPALKVQEVKRLLDLGLDLSQAAAHEACPGVRHFIEKMRD